MLDEAFDYRDAQLETGCHDRWARLVHRGGKLVAVIVRLDDEIHGALRGSWNLEVGFGKLAGQVPPPFATFGDCKEWLTSIYRPTPAAVAAAQGLVDQRQFQE